MLPRPRATSGKVIRNGRSSSVSSATGCISVARMLTVSSRTSTWPRTCTTASCMSSVLAASYTLPKNMHWMELSMSSMVTIAHGLPFFETRRSTLVISPASVTCCPLGMVGARSIRWAMDISRIPASTACMPLSGWSDT